MTKESAQKLLGLVNNVYSAVVELANFANELEQFENQSLVYKCQDTNLNEFSPVQQVQCISAITRGLEGAQKTLFAKIFHLESPSKLALMLLNEFLQRRN